MDSKVPMLSDGKLRKMSSNDAQKSRQFFCRFLTFHHNNGDNYARKSYFWKFVLLILTLLAIASSALLIHEWIRMNEFAKLQPISTVPFPSLTICPETKAKKSIIDFSSGYFALSSGNESILSDDDLKNLEALSQVCDPHLFTKPITSNATSGKEFESILKEVSENFILFCKFQNQIINCSDYFSDIATSEGICKTFQISQIPIISGANYGLNVVLSSNRNDTDFICKGPMQGFKYKIHPSNEFPNFQHSFSRVPVKSDVTSNIKPKLIHNRDSACSEESESNCLRKCSASYVLSHCGCVSFHMPHEDETPICNQHENFCILKALDEFAINVTTSLEFPCNCRPSCKTVKYEESHSYSEYDFVSVIRAYREDLEGEFPVTDMSRLTIYFEESYATQETIGKSSILSLISKIGGVLAFFLGVSV